LSPAGTTNIWQHRVHNNDWSNDWLFDDSRFDMMTGPADTGLRFLCEMLHPVVRNDAEEVGSLRESINEFLRPDGVELYEASRISGRPVFAARKLSVGNATVITAVQAVTPVLNADYVRQQTDRLLVALDEDAELAIGTAKEFVLRQQLIFSQRERENATPVNPPLSRELRMGLVGCGGCFIGFTCPKIARPNS
jgi:hypothetical protein